MNKFITDNINTIINGDCLDVMKQLPDKSIDLVLTDPPYGIGAGSKKFINGTSKTVKNYYKENDWDDKIPEEEIFKQIFRISKNQVIFGGNYFIEYLKNTRCFLVWDKTIHGNSYADCELIWTSFDNVARIKYMNICNVDKDGREHPTQKPIKLIEWCIKQSDKYLKEDSIILDCFSGSGTTAIACHNLNRNFICIEKDVDYYNASVERLNNAKAQMRLF